MAENKKTRKNKRKVFWTIAFIAINIAVIAITAVSEFGNSANAAKLSEVHINGWFLIPAVICFIVALGLEFSKYTLMMRKLAPKDFDAKKSRKVARRTVLLGKYYDNITPAAVGGQPFQIYYMRKNSNFSTGISTTIPITAMVAGQLGFLVIAIFCFILGASTINNIALISAACLGLLVYAFWPIIALIATFWPKAAKKVINFGVKLLVKVRIVKNKTKALEKVEYEVDEYVRCLKTILNTKFLFMKTILLSIGFNALITTIPFFVLTAFGGDVNFAQCFINTVAVTAAVYFVPTPGNSGAAEGAFFMVFSALSTGYIFWAMLTWRFFSYYIYIIIGIIIYIVMHFEEKRVRIE